MPKSKCSDQDFIALFEEHGASGTAERLGVLLDAVYKRRKRLEVRIGRQILSPNGERHGSMRTGIHHPARLHIGVENGVVLVASDAHYWPGVVTAAHKAFVQFCDEMNPKAVIMNGDVFDGASVSRHPSIGWEERPTVQEEIDTCQDRLREIQAASEKARHIWTLGNHDGRFETRLATVAPEYARVNGVHLKDHFPLWENAWSCWINESVVVKHRYKGGVHATHNNAIWSGKSIVTGHLHSLKVTPFSDYNGCRWGVDTGTLCGPPWPQAIDYLEDNPVNWRSGFAVLTFHNGRMLWPEVVHAVSEDEVEFRGKVIRV